MLYLPTFLVVVIYRLFHTLPLWLTARLAHVARAAQDEIVVRVRADYEREHCVCERCGLYMNRPTAVTSAGILCRRCLGVEPGRA